MATSQLGQGCGRDPSPLRGQAGAGAAASQAAKWWAPAPGTCVKSRSLGPVQDTSALPPALPRFRRYTMHGSSLVQAGCGYTSKQTRPGFISCPKRPAVHAGSIDQPTWIDFFSPKKQGGQIQAGLGEQSPACVTPACA